MRSSLHESPTRRVFRITFRLLSYRPPRLAVPPQGMSLHNVTVVNPGDERLEKQTLVVEGDRIVRLADSQPDAAADQTYAGCYILPGLIDMHVHIPPPARALANLLFLAHGVTGVREVGDADGTTWAGREQIQRGDIPGPRIFTCGPVLDGDPPFLPTSLAIRTPEQAVAVVTALAARGADFIKIQHKMTAPILAAVCRAAADNGLRVAGHVPVTVPFELAHIWDVQHLDGLVTYPQPTESPLDYQQKWCDLTAAQIDAYVRTSVDQGIVHTPTLFCSHTLAQMANPVVADAPAVRLLPRYYRDAAWDRRSMPLFKRFSDATLKLLELAEARCHDVVLHLHRAGVRLHLGTDTAAMIYVVPGVSLHEELRIMVELGLSLEEAWKAGTCSAGHSLGIPLLGTVKVNAPADLLIFGADPTRDLRALSTLKGVVAQGRFYTKDYLDSALVRHRERFENPIYDNLTTLIMRQALKAMVPTN
jgi:imidazolonepropionase-like amidohydrolase